MFEPVKKGDTGTDVYIMQSFLHVLQFTGRDGKPLKIDGTCGDDSVYAINQFQEKQRIFGYECGSNGKNDGIFGRACWYRIGVIN